MEKKYFFVTLLTCIILISGCIKQQNKAPEKVQERKFTLQLNETATFSNGYGVRFAGLPFAGCPSGLPKEANTEVSGVEFTLLDKKGLIVKDELGNDIKIVICKGESRKITELGNIELNVLNFNYAEYPSGEPEIAPVVEFNIKPTIAPEHYPSVEPQELCKKGNGIWREFPNSGEYCHDECNNPENLICNKFMSMGCDCGIKKCWNGNSCVSE